MANITKRAVFGAVFVVAVTTAVIWHFYLFLILFLLLAILSVWELNQLLPSNNVLPESIATTALLFIITALFLYNGISGYWFLAALSIPLIVFAKSFAREPIKEWMINGLKYWSISVLYPGIGFITTVLLFFPPQINYQYSWRLIMSILVMTWVHDTFAYLTGITFGKTRLFPKVSPKKSVEGAVGGLLATVLLAIIIYFSKPALNMTLFAWAGMGLVVALASVAGDYVESRLKRKAGVKDAGMILPGHGGVLDRMDSLMVAAPAAWIYALLIA